jgi:hypothetical protein
MPKRAVEEATKDDEDKVLVKRTQFGESSIVTAARKKVNKLEDDVKTLRSKVEQVNAVKDPVLQRESRLTLFETEAKELERARLEFSLANATQSLAEAQTEERTLKYQNEVDRFRATIRVLYVEWRERYEQRKRELERDFPFVSSTVTNPSLELILQDFQYLERFIIVGRTFQFVPPTIFQSTVDSVIKLLNEVPIDESRKISYPALIGPMGIGKTRTCEEICTSVMHQRSLFGGDCLIMYVDIRNFKRVVYLEKNVIRTFSHRQWYLAQAP